MAGVPGQEGTHEPTDEKRATVVALCSEGASMEEIGAAIGGIGRECVRKHYAPQLQEARGVWKDKFRESLFRKILKEDCGDSLLIFAAKTQLRWTPPPTETKVTLGAEDVDGLTTAELRAIAAGTDPGDSGPRGS